jgi:hypothetical protein
MKLALGALAAGTVIHNYKRNNSLTTFPSWKFRNNQLVDDGYYSPDIRSGFNSLRSYDYRGLPGRMASGVSARARSAYDKVFNRSKAEGDSTPVAQVKAENAAATEELLGN